LELGKDLVLMFGLALLFVNDINFQDTKCIVYWWQNLLPYVALQTTRIALYCRTVSKFRIVELLVL